MPSISVLMPCYNVASTVDEAITSLLGQTFTDFEVVAVDDGSTDGTLSALKGWENRDRRVNALALPHQGIIPSLNTGLAACHSEFVARMDADDRSLPSRLACQVEMLAANPNLAVTGSLVQGFPEGQVGADFTAYIEWINSRISDAEIKGGMFIQSPLAHPSTAYRRSWIERVGGYQDHGWAEDYDLWMRLFLSGAEFGKVNQVLLEWRDHPRRLTHTDSYYSKASDLRLKAHYLAHGPLSASDGVFVWGLSASAQCLVDHLILLQCPVQAFVETSPKPASVEQSIDIINPHQFAETLTHYHHPVVLMAESDPASQAAGHLRELGLQEMIDWWKVA